MSTECPKSHHRVRTPQGARMGEARSSTRRRLSAVAAVAGLVIVIAACSSSSSKPPTASGSNSTGTCSNIPAGPIKVANIVPLSGPIATTGELQVNVSEIDVNYFNQHDSICGHKISLTNYNDKGDPATSLGIARQLVSQGETILMQDSYGQIQSAIQPYLMQHHVVVITLNGGYSLLNPTVNPTFFSVAPSNAQYAQSMVAWAKSHNLNNIGILNDGTPFSVELAQDVEQDIKAAGLHFVTEVTYSATAIDLATPLTQAKEAGVDTLMPTGFTAIPAMVSGIKQLGWKPTIVSWGALLTYGVTPSQVPPGAADGCDIYFSAKGQESTLLTPENTSLADALKAKIGVTSETSDGLLTYVDLLAFKTAVEKANSLDGLKLAAALESTTNMSTNIPGLTETWSPTDHTGFPASNMTQCQLQTGPFDIPYKA
jgi:ABC-type branched-subunit amino acid transport system substrate-binding protein